MLVGSLLSHSLTEKQIYPTVIIVSQVFINLELDFIIPCKKQTDCQT
jgi:hypothetical protein